MGVRFPPGTLRLLAGSGLGGPSLKWPRVGSSPTPRTNFSPLGGASQWAMAAVLKTDEDKTLGGPTPPPSTTMKEILNTLYIAANFPRALWLGIYTKIFRPELSSDGTDTLVIAITSAVIFGALSTGLIAWYAFRLSGLSHAGTLATLVGVITYLWICFRHARNE